MSQAISWRRIFYYPALEPDTYIYIRRNDRVWSIRLLRAGYSTLNLCSIQRTCKCVHFFQLQHLPYSRNMSHEAGNVGYRVYNITRSFSSNSPSSHSGQSGKSKPDAHVFIVFDGNRIIHTPRTRTAGWVTARCAGGENALTDVGLAGERPLIPSASSSLSVSRLDHLSR